MLQDISGIFKSLIAMKRVFLILEVTWHFYNKEVSLAILSKSLDDMKFKDRIQFTSYKHLIFPKVLGL